MEKIYSLVRGNKTIDQSTANERCPAVPETSHQLDFNLDYRGGFLSSSIQGIGIHPTDKAVIASEFLQIL